MQIAVIGHGRVGAALAHGLRSAGHVVTLAVHDPDSSSLRRALARSPGLRTATPREAVHSADVVLLATPFAAARAVLPPLAEDLAGRVLVDCTNPVGPGLTHGLGSARSGSEAIRDLAPGARVVKAFSIYGYENLEDPAFPGVVRDGRPVLPMMPIAGDDAAAKTSVARLAADLGWDPLDVGGLVQALHLEHLTLLWVRMVRAGGRSPHLVWAALSR